MMSIGRFEEASNAQYSNFFYENCLRALPFSCFSA